MTPQVAQGGDRINWLTADTLDSNLVLDDFLCEMDELDHLQDTPMFASAAKCHELAAPPPTKVKTVHPLDTQDESSVPKKRRNTSWLRRKQEIQALRDETAKLESQLAFMHLHCEDTMLLSSEVLTENEAHWKSVATIARERCQDAQHENARLKEQLQQYSAATEMLQSRLIDASLQQQVLLDRCASLEQAARVGSIARSSLRLENSEILDILETKLNARIHELDTIVGKTVRSLAHNDRQNMRVCREEGCEAVPTVEFEYDRLFPYGEDTTASTIWEVIEVGGVRAKEEVQTIRRSVDVVGAKTRLTMPVAGVGSITVDTVTIAKRFIVSIGLVILVQSYSEWSVHPKAGAPWQHTTEECGWVVVRQHPSVKCRSLGGEKQYASQVCTMVKLRPNGDDKCPAARSTFTGAVGDIVIPSFHDILSSHHQHFENFLLDSARARAQ